MIWIEVVCDGCCNNPIGETYRSNSVSRIKKQAKEIGWKTINGKIYCPECQERMRKQREWLRSIMGCQKVRVRNDT